MRQLIQFGRAGAQDWGDKPLAIVGGGPSLKGFDFAGLRGHFRILAVNAVIFDLPFADAGFSLDRRAMRHWWAKLRRQRMPLYFAVPDCFLVNFADAPTAQMNFLRRVHGTEFSSDPARISAGGTSGFGALHLAFLKGAKRIVLLGFDYGAMANAWHHNEDHYDFAHSQDAAKWRQWAANFEQPAGVMARAGIEVVNASPGSAITAFPKCSIDEALQ